VKIERSELLIIFIVSPCGDIHIFFRINNVIAIRSLLGNWTFSGKYELKML